MRISFNWLKDFIDIKGGIEKAQRALTMVGLEVNAVVPLGKDNVMDIEVTPNRPDCLSILGVARELSAATLKPLTVPMSIKKYYAKKGPSNGNARIDVQDKKACSRYVGCIMKNIKVGPSPEWLVERLNAMGVRSVNNIVDITNYVLFETGQPLHAFDLEKLEKNRIVVRKARKGENITAIDGVTRELDPTMLIIADINKPVAIAGIMGGKDTEITEGTKAILLESAYFDPVSVRKAQRKLTLASESSYRFERGVDFSMILSASMRAQEMIKDIAGGRCVGNVTDIGGKAIKEREVVLSLDDLPRILGIDISLKDITHFLNALDLKISKKTKAGVSIKIPPYRGDLERGIDIIEEIARLYGYDKIPSKIPVFTVQKTYEEEKKQLSLFSEKTKNILTLLGLNEILTYTMTSRSSIEALGISFDNVIRLQNPLSSNQAFMRPTLISEMLEAASWNINRKNTPVKLFELSKAYSIDKAKNEIKEKLMLCFSVSGVTAGNWKDKSRDADFFDLKGVCEKLLSGLGLSEYSLLKEDTSIFKEGMSVVLKVKGQMLGAMGEVKPNIARFFDIKEKIYIGEIDFEKLTGFISLDTRFKQLPRYPSIRRDISIIVDKEVPSSGISEVIKNTGRDIVTSIDIFDLYKGQQIQEGKKSLAYSIEYRSNEKTLKDEDVSQVHTDIQEELVKKLGVQIR
ncbi:MAG: phenylalanine--tRNA ligase subunit beta [Candidatus Omnitrophota bacterium]